MAARKGEPQARTTIEKRRALVRKLRFGRELTQTAIVDKLQARGIVTSRTTVARDEQILQKEFAATIRNFDPLAAIAVRAERLRVITARAMRSALRTADDGYRARLLRVATHAITAEVDDRSEQSVNLKHHFADGIRVRFGTIRRGMRLKNLNGRSNFGCRSHKHWDNLFRSSPIHPSPQISFRVGECSFTA